MTWSTNITEAQTGDYVWLATKCGRVVRSYWVSISDRSGDGYWGMSMGLKEEPLAWQPYVKPVHPFELAKQEESAA